MTKPKYLMAIDPGIGGAIAVRGALTKKIKVFDMPKNPHDITDLLYASYIVMPICYIEQIQARENDKTHVSSAMKLMKNYGICLGALYSQDWKVNIVKPSVWMSGFVKAGLSYEARKKSLNVTAKILFPKLKFKKSQADALCLLAYGMTQEELWQ